MMCTSLIYQSKDQSNFLSRTMDFAFELDASPVYLPRGYVFKSNIVSNVTYKSKYAFLGAGRKLEDYFFADGLNEKGFQFGLSISVTMLNTILHKNQEK